jgi:hypothetical protein
MGVRTARGWEILRRADNSKWTGRETAPRNMLVEFTLPVLTAVCSWINLLKRW